MMRTHEEYWVFLDLKKIDFWLLSIQSNALNRPNNRDCSLRAYLFLSYHIMGTMWLYCVFQIRIQIFWSEPDQVSKNIGSGIGVCWYPDLYNNLYSEIKSKGIKYSILSLIAYFYFPLIVNLPPFFLTFIFWTW